MAEAEAVVINDRAENLVSLGSSSVRLVITSPPFFDDATEQLLRQTRSDQKDFDGVRKSIISLASSMQHAFLEIARVLRKDGTFVLHTKDIRFGDALIPLTAKHEAVAEICGFRISTRIYWQPTDRPLRSGKKIKTRILNGYFRAPEVETFSIFRFPGDHRKRSGARAETPEESWLTESFWRTPGESAQPRHPHASPPEVMRRLIALFTEPGDLVLDPFCGGGGLLDVARNMGRNAVGFEIDPARAEMARCRLRRS